MKVDNEEGALLCDSAMIVKHLPINPNVAQVVCCESTSTFESIKYEKKSFGTTKPVDSIGDVYEFPG